jgi:hypothetical protein
MPESPRRVDLRLTIPAAASFHPLAMEVAEKFAEYAGAERAAAQQFAARLQRSITSIADSNGNQEIAIEFATEGHELIATANCGANSDRTAVPLRD